MGLARISTCIDMYKRLLEEDNTMHQCMHFLRRTDRQAQRQYPRRRTVVTVERLSKYKLPSHQTRLALYRPLSLFIPINPRSMQIMDDHISIVMAFPATLPYPFHSHLPRLAQSAYLHPLPLAPVDAARKEAACGRCR